jgi:hypothetical protein
VQPGKRPYILCLASGYDIYLSFRDRCEFLRETFKFLFGAQKKANISMLVPIKVSEIVQLREDKR